MAYLVIEDSRGGVDRRRPMYSAKPGTLWSCINAHITLGGDIEKRKAFVGRGGFSSNTFGLATLNETLYTFGSDDPAVVTVPGGVTYVRLTHPSAGTSMTALVAVDLFDGKFYVAAAYADGSVQHFYDGTLIPDWNDGIARAYMSNVQTVAAALASLINGSGSYDAVAAGNVITITAVQLNQAFTVNTFVSGVDGGVNDQTMVYVTTTPASPGVAQVGTLTLGGTFEVGDRWGVSLTTATVTEDFGNYAKPWGNATCAKTHKRKVYVGAEKILQFSAVNDAIGWDVDLDVGAGFLNSANHLGGSQIITALGTYQGQLAMFARRAVQLWTMQNDDAQNDLRQTLENTGTRSPLSVLEFAGNDLFYLDDIGIRSLRPRDASSNAFASGVGAAINKVVRDWMRNSATDSQIEGAVSIVEPEEGRFWMAIGSRIFVYSYFPESSITGWSWYEPGFTVTHFARTHDRVWARGDDDQLYLYGGSSGDEYDSSQVTVEFPFFTANKDGTFKNWTGMDIAADSTWTVGLRIEPNDVNQVVEMGSNTGVTMPGPGWSAVGHSTHIAPVFSHAIAEYAQLSKVLLYYNEAESNG